PRKYHPCSSRPTYLSSCPCSVAESIPSANTLTQMACSAIATSDRLRSLAHHRGATPKVQKPSLALLGPEIQPVGIAAATAHRLIARVAVVCGAARSIKMAIQLTSSSSVLSRGHG